MKRKKMKSNLLEDKVFSFEAIVILFETIWNAYKLK